MKLITFIVFTALTFLFFSPANALPENIPSHRNFINGNDTTASSIFAEKNDAWVEKEMSGMTLKEKAGQLVFPAVSADYISSDSREFDLLKHYVNDLHVGGFIFFHSNIYDQVVLLNKLQAMSKVPLLISSDFERGVAQHVRQATLFPYNMGLGAADDSLLTYKMGNIIAEEGRAIGVQQDYAPVVDVNTNPANPIINVRSFGDRDKLVERLSGALIKGLQDGKMIATAKHFPGHGNTSTDSHRSLPVIPGSKKDLEKTELPPFENAVDQGVMSVMVAHLDVPAFESTPGLPSTLSHSIVTGLLKDQLGFKGLIVTDAMEMHAITNSFTTAQAAVMAVKAGDDAVLLPKDPDEAVNAIVDAVNKGEISESRLDHSVKQILLAKKWAGLNDGAQTDINNVSNVVGIIPHWEVANELSRKSITLVRDENNLIPLSANPAVKYLCINIFDSNNPRTGRAFVNELSTQLENMSVVSITPESQGKQFKAVMDSVSGADVILLSAYTHVVAYKGSISLNEDQVKLIKEILSSGKKVVFMSHGDPYILSEFSNAETYLCNYGDTDLSEIALADALTGGISIEGKLPVTIPGAHAKFGSGISTEKSALRNLSYFKQGEEQNKFAQVDSIVKASIADSAFPCAVLLVAQNGVILHEKAFGDYMYDPASGPVNVNTMYDLASLTKVTATTTATMICYDRGLFKLDDKVAKYLPKFGVNGKENVTIRNLLVHDSGLRPDIPSYRAFDSVQNKEQGVMNVIFNDSLVYPTGTKMVYSDLNFILMGKIIEKVTGETLDKFCEENIFKPLGMNSTMFNPPASLVSRIAPTEDDNYWRHRQIRGTVHDETSQLLGGVAGHAGLFSTAGDLAKLLQMLLQKGYYQGKRYIKASTVEMFVKKQSDLSSRALGWDTKSPDYSSAGHLFSDISYGHTGFTGTSLWTDPTRNLFVVFLTNRVYPTRKNLKILHVRPLVHDAVIRAIEK